MTTTTPMRPGDARAAARLHLAAFPEFFLSSLGERFLREFYRAFLEDDTSVHVTARDADGTLVAVAVGTLDPRGFFGRLVRRRAFGFAAAAARTVVRRPSVAPRLAAALRYRGEAPEAPRGAALLSSICVAPSAQGGGVGTAVLEAWVTEVAGRGAERAYLTTDAEGNESTNAFYRRHGWTVSATFTTRHGRVMNCYVKELADAR